MSSLNSSSDRFGTYCFVSHTTLAWPSHVSCLFICSLLMFSHVQFSTRVIFGFAILLSNHVFCQPCRHFRVDIFSVISMIFFTRTSIFAWVNTTILLLCINRQLKCCNPAVVRLLTLPKIPAFWYQALAYFAAQIVAHHFVFWHDSLLLVDCHSPLTIRPHTSGRLTVPSEPSSIANTAMHPHHRPSCILRAPHPSETHACRSPTSSSRSLPPSALQPRLHGASHLKDSEHHHRVEHHFTPPTRSSAPHHLLLVSALFAASRASSMSCTILHPSR